MQQHVTVYVHRGVGKLQWAALTDVKTTGGNIHRGVTEAHPRQLHQTARIDAGIVEYPAVIRQVFKGIVVTPSLIVFIAVNKNRRATHINGRHVLDTLRQQILAVSFVHHATVEEVYGPRRRACRAKGDIYQVSETTAERGTRQSKTGITPGCRPRNDRL